MVIIPIIVFLALERTIEFIIIFIIATLMTIILVITTLFGGEIFEEHQLRMKNGEERKKWKDRRKTEKLWAILIVISGLGMALAFGVAIFMFVFSQI